jgi:hypothetical protein
MTSERREEETHTLHMRRGHTLEMWTGKTYLAHEERKVIPWRCGQERHTLHMRRGGHTLEMWPGKTYLAHEERRSYLGDVDRKDIPCT